MVGSVSENFGSEAANVEPKPAKQIVAITREFLRLVVRERKFKKLVFIYLIFDYKGGIMVHCCFSAGKTNRRMRNFTFGYGFLFSKQK